MINYHQQKKQQGRVVRKAINANSRLEVHWRFHRARFKMVLKVNFELKVKKSLSKN